ncbi:MAG: YoaP domain-containing protein [Eubacterium sp.]|nr:YoaP domain-containing protein [Eubacterium sp.]
MKTAAGSKYWRASTLRKILRNEKYIGDALLQKTVTVDFLTKKRVENKGIYALFHDGEYITNEQMNDKKFLKLVNG